MKQNGLMVAATLVVLYSVLTACGFRLRGDVELPSVLQDVYLESKDPYTGMARALRIELEVAGGRIVDSSEQATAVLAVVRERSENRILSVGSTGRASEYELFDEVVFSLSDTQGNVLIKPQTLRMIRDLVFDETQLLGKIEEAERLHVQMRRNLARQIITRIDAGLRQK